MDFQKSTEYLLSLGNEVSAMKLGLESIRKLLGAIDSPHERYFKVQVAGTNGKGSVCAFLNSICVTAGIHVGMYTSPHLVSITERIKIDGADISEDDFARLATVVREHSEKLVAAGELESVPTFFEQVTAIALLAFAEAEVELAILETGLGGRLDATTAANAEIAAITRIDLDHQQYLGETLPEIAAEKASIIHKGSQAVVGEQHPDAMKVILERCKSRGIVPHIVSQALDVTARNPTGTTSVYEPGEKTTSLGVGSLPLGSRNLGLPGGHQIENARIAVEVAYMLRHRFQITDESIAVGLRDARHPGRLEWIGRFLLDGAHNVGGALALRKYLDEFVTQPITMIFGAMNDKAVAEIASVLFPAAHRIVLTTIDNSRASSGDELMESVPRNFHRQNLSVTPSVSAAIETARDISGEQDTIVVTGSLYLVGEVRRILRQLLRNT